VTLAPRASLLVICTGIRSSSRVGRPRSPLALLVALPPIQKTPTLHLNAFRGVRAISRFDWPFTPTHRSSEHFSTYTGSVLQFEIIEPSTCPWVDHRGFASAPTSYAPYSDSLSLRLHPFLGFKLASQEQLVGSLCKRHAVTPHCCKAPTACKRMVSGSFHSPFRGPFHLSLTVLVHYRSLRSI
jgi:hypothetical protein